MNKVWVVISGVFPLGMVLKLIVSDESLTFHREFNVGSEMSAVYSKDKPRFPPCAKQHTHSLKWLLLLGQIALADDFEPLEHKELIHLMDECE